MALDTYLVVNEEQRLAALRSDLQFDSGLAPHILGVKDIKHVTWLHLFDSMLVLPFIVVLESILVALVLCFVSLLLFEIDHVGDSTVNEVRLVKAPLTDVFPAVGALFLSDKSFIDADFTERVATEGGAAADDVVHADGASQDVLSTLCLCHN